MNRAGPEQIGSHPLLKTELSLGNGFLHLINSNLTPSISEISEIYLTFLFEMQQSSVTGELLVVAECASGDCSTKCGDVVCYPDIIFLLFDFFNFKKIHD